MPRKYVKKTTKKTPVKKRQFRGKTTINKTVVSAGLGFPKKMEMTHKYQGSVGLVGTSGVFAAHSFSCNSLYDPDATGTGHQPLYRDQMQNLYNHYVVIGSRAQISFIPTSGTYGSAAVGCFINDDQTLTTTSFPAAIEQSIGKYKYVTYNNSSPSSFSLNWSAKKVFGGSILANTELQGTATTNPLEQQFFTVWAQSLDGTTSISFWVEIVITYITIWKELIDVGQS